MHLTYHIQSYTHKRTKEGGLVGFTITPPKSELWTYGDVSQLYMELTRMMAEMKDPMNEYVWKSK